MTSTMTKVYVHSDNYPVPQNPVPPTTTPPAPDPPATPVPLALSSHKENSLFHKDISKIITMGIPRTGSTFQQVLLCVIAHLRSDSVSCGGDQHASLQVIKMHPYNGTINIDKSTLFFTTVRDNVEEFKKSALFWTGGDTVYSQRFIDFTKCPLCEIGNYRQIFNLTTYEENQLKQYMRYWSILRQCCGSQMSKWFRAELFGCPNMTDSVMEGKLDYHMCGSWNLSSVESRFMQTPLYMRVPASRLAKKNTCSIFGAKKETVKNQMTMQEQG